MGFCYEDILLIHKSNVKYKGDYAKIHTDEYERLGSIIDC